MPKILLINISFKYQNSFLLKLYYNQFKNKKLLIFIIINDFIKNSRTAVNGIG